jgi:hypothetical protein
MIFTINNNYMNSIKWSGFVVESKFVLFEVGIDSYV